MTTNPVTTPKIISPIPGFKVTLCGPSGSGKTHAIRSLCEAGYEVFVIFTENGQGLLNDIPSSQLKWKYIPLANVDWDSMLDSQRKINTMSFEMLTQLKDINKREYSQMMELVATCKEFIDDRTGENYGDVSSWGTNRVLVLDSLSGLNQMALDLVVGSKPVKSMSDWGVAMDNLGRLINRFCMLHTNFVMTAHVERETNEITGGVQLMVSTLGKKLPALLPRFFDEIIYTRSGDQFLWSNQENNFALKYRFLPQSSKLPPTFVTLKEAWLKKGGLIENT